MSLTPMITDETAGWHSNHAIATWATVASGEGQGEGGKEVNKRLFLSTNLAQEITGC